jgi:hypothetical protein
VPPFVIKEKKRINIQMKLTPIQKKGRICRKMCVDVPQTAQNAFWSHESVILQLGGSCSSRRSYPNENNSKRSYPSSGPQLTTSMNIVHFTLKRSFNHKFIHSVVVSRFFIVMYQSITRRVLVHE